MMFPMRKGWALPLFLTLFLSLQARAEFVFNNNLSKAQRESILKTLGLGTLSKNLSQPAPLGTDSGVEMALVTEVISTREIKPYIRDSQNKNVLYYPKILLGKGLYRSTDIFFHFIPFTSTLGVSEFGAMLRVHLYESPNQFFNSSLMVHANSANFNNQLSTRNIGGDLSFGLTWTNNVSVFAGIGQVSSKGTFVGGPSGVTDTGFSESEAVESMHYSLGSMYKHDIYTFGVSWDHYADAVYTFKLGVQF